MFETLEAYSYALFTRVLGWPMEKINQLLDRVRLDLKNPKYHMFTR